MSLAQGAAGVRLQARIAGGAAGGTDQTLRAHDAIACDDGARGVRSQLGTALDDLDFDEPLAGGRCAGERARPGQAPLWGQAVVISSKAGGLNTIGALAAPAHRARGNCQSRKRSSFGLSCPRQCPGCTPTVELEAADKCQCRSLTLTV